MTNQINHPSFIIHKDSLLILDQLSDDQAGKLFKAIYLYQKTGKIGDVDQITKIIITPFLSQFSRDQEKYSNSIFQGKLGNLKKYHNDIYLKVVAEELTLEEGENLAYPDKKLLRRPPITTDQMGSLSVNVNVSVNDSVSIKEKDSPKISKSKTETNNSQFEEFWNLYNKKIGKPDAEKKFKNSLNKDSFENIIVGLNTYIKSRGDDSKYWKHPSTWLHQECWKDEYSQQPAQNNQPLCQAINKLIGSNLITKIETIGNKAAFYTSKDGWQSITALDSNTKSEIKKTLNAALGVSEIEPKY